MSTLKRIAISIGLAVLVSAASWIITAVVMPIMYPEWPSKVIADWKNIVLIVSATSGITAWMAFGFYRALK